MSDEIKWSSEFALGIDTIDNDHKTLFSMVNDLKNVVENGGEGLRGIVDGLTQYYHGHFEREEYLMLEFNYPHYAEHAKQHRYFMRLIYAVRRIMSDQSDMLDTGKFLQFLEQWLSNHIQTVDFKLGEYLKRGYVNKEINWNKDLSEWLSVRANDQEVHDLITIKVRVPLSAAVVMRRCARILNDGGEEAEALTSQTDPTRLLSSEDAKKLARMLVIGGDEDVPQVPEPE